MATPVIMPRQGQSVETCIITEWNKQTGDTIAKGDVICAYETDKASFEIEAEEDGTLLAVFFEDGDEVPVLENIAVIGAEGDDVEQFRPGSAQAEAPEAAPAEEKPAAPKATSETEPPAAAPAPTADRDSDSVRISPRARNKASRKGVAHEAVQGTGPKGRVIERDIDKAIESGQQRTAAAAEISTPQANEVEGTGLGGRITSSDVASGNTVYSNDSEVKKLSNIRKIIAKRMHESLQNSAQLTHHMSADVRRLMDARKAVKAKMAEENGPNITLNDMVCFATIKALKKFPDANSHFLGTEMRVFNKIHLGLAVDTPRGLMVPALKNADDLSLAGLSNQLKALADSCRQGNVDPALLESTAASFTVSNLGAYGVEMFTPVINLPQAAILGVNTIINRPADVGNGVFGFVPYIGLSLTYDHRALDGGPATLFLREIKEQIENFNETI